MKFSSNKPCVQPQRGARLAVEMSKSGLILSHTLQFFNLTFSPEVSFRLPASQIRTFSRSRHSIFHVTWVWNQNRCQEVVECWHNSRHLPAFTHRWRRLSAERTKHMFALSSSPTCSRKVTGNVRRVSPRHRISRSTCLASMSAACDGFLFLLLRNGMRMMEKRLVFLRQLV